jgi:hypothetical protein
MPRARYVRLGRCCCSGWCGALGEVAARGGVGALDGVGMRGAPCALCQRARGTSSSSSSSSVKPATTLRRFRLLSSSSIISGPPVPRGSVDFLFWEGPSGAGRFPAAFLVIRGSCTSMPAGQSSVGTSETYTAAQSWPRILQTSDWKLRLCPSNSKHQN